MKIESMPQLLRVRDWDRLYENNRSREIDRTSWFPAPNDLAAGSYVEVVTHAEGAAHFGAWNALLMVASRAKPRGTLVRDDGRPHTAESLALVTRLPKQLIETAIERLLEIGHLEIGGSKRRMKNNLRSHPSAAPPQDGAAKSQKGAAEGKGTEHHHQEEKGKTKNGTASARAQAHAGSSGSTGEKPFPKKSDDDEPAPDVTYASPDDELKAIYPAKAGEPMAVGLLDAILANLAAQGVDMADFVAEAKGHLQNKLYNPAGFLRDLSKRFRSKTQASSEPVTAAEAAARDYRCEVCGSTTPGEGVRFVDGKFAPCSCASPEYIDRQRSRGVFVEKTAS
jgi:hypothetical protein